MKDRISGYCKIPVSQENNQRLSSFNVLSIALPREIIFGRKIGHTDRIKCLENSIASKPIILAVNTYDPCCGSKYLRLYE